MLTELQNTIKLYEENNDITLPQEIIDAINTASQKIIELENKVNGTNNAYTPYS